MASWMIHLRIADILLNQLDLLPTEFVVGNIAPDSGVPNEDWTVFTPSTNISHFKDTNKNVDVALYVSQHFTPEQQNQYNKKQYSFYLGYLTHLLTDVLWVKHIAQPTFQKFEDPIAKKCLIVETIKDDWYDLDYLYLRNHPDFRAFHIYDEAVGFVNSYLDVFSVDAFDNRRQYITDFYRQTNNNLDRNYPYLTAAQADAFVEFAALHILSLLKSQYCVETPSQP